MPGEGAGPAVRLGAGARPRTCAGSWPASRSWPGRSARPSALAVGRRNPVIAVMGGVLTAVLVLVTIGSLLAAGRFAEIAEDQGKSAATERLARLEAVQAHKITEKAEKEATAEKNGPTTRPKSPGRTSITRRCTWPSRRGGNTAACRTCASCSPTGFPRAIRPTAAAGSGSTSTRSLTRICEPSTESRGIDQYLTVAWHAASNRLAAGTADGLIRIWDVDREQTILTLRGPRASGIHWCGAGGWRWSPDGGKLAAGYPDGTVHVWETASGRELHVFRGHESRVSSVAFNSDGGRWPPGHWMARSRSGTPIRAG